MNNKTKKNQNRTLLYLLLLVVATGIIGSVTYARYVQQRQGEDSARVAQAVLRFIGGSPNLADFVPGETQYYTFQVTNADELSNVGEVTLQYSFTFNFEAEEDVPLLDLTYDLFYKPDPSANEEHVGMLAGSPTQSNPITIGHSNEETHTLILAITWGGTQLDAATYAGVKNTFTIVTNVEQVN